MKYYINVIFFLFGIGNFYSQNLHLTESQEKFFVQVVLVDSENSIFTEIETELRNNPYVYMVRFDKITNGLFVVTKDIQVLTRLVFESWMGDHESLIKCYRDGIHGTDTVLPFNSNFCEPIVE